MDNGSEKKLQRNKKCVIKRKNMFGNYTNCLFNDKIILKLQQRFKSYLHNVYTEEVKKIPLSSNDDKRLQTFDRVTTYPHGKNIFKVYESKMMIVRDLFVENYLNFHFYVETILQKRLKKSAKR